MVISTLSSSCVLRLTDGSILVIQHQLSPSLCNTPLCFWITHTLTSFVIQREAKTDVKLNSALRLVALSHG